MNIVFLDEKSIPKDVKYEKMIFSEDFDIVYDSKPYSFKKDTEYFIDYDFALFIRYSNKYNPNYKNKIKKDITNESDIKKKK